MRGAPYPGYFGHIEQARDFCRRFFIWDNNEHRHGGIALYTPANVHHARVEERRLARKIVLSAAYKAHPERFVNGAPAAQTINPIVDINPPELSNAA